MISQLLNLQVAVYAIAYAIPITPIENDFHDNFIDLSHYADIISEQSFRQNSGKLATSNNISSSFNPEEFGSYLEGDIFFPTITTNYGRNGLLALGTRWPGAVVPYEIRGRFSSRDLSIIRRAFNEYHVKTCVRFQERTTELDYITIENAGSGCWSSVGRMGGKQVVNLQTPICLRNYGTAIHELMHALGFFHEQNRHERDDFVKVQSENVKSNMIVNFGKSSSKDSHGFGVKYDYASIMHYSPTSFSKNGKPTLVALKKTKDSELMGQRSGFSVGDVRKIKAMYKCK